MRHVRFLIPCLLLAGCGGTGAARPQAPAPLPLSALVPLRTLTWAIETDEPQPAWHPSANRVVVANQGGGFTILEDGRPPADFGADDKRYFGHPRWIDGERIVFGARDNVVRTGEGRVVPSADGLTEITVGATVTDRRQLWTGGWRPRVGPDAVWTQFADMIVRVPFSGDAEEFGPGFLPEPQADGPGVCWQETPITTPDLWTQHTGAGALVVRWKPGVVTTYPRCLQARWVAGGGGLVVTRLKGEPPTPAQGPWWKPGTEVLHIAGPEAAPRLVLDDARDPDPNPAFALVAARSAQGPIQVATLDGSDATAVAEAGERPLWNCDGTRLLYQAQQRDGGAAPRPVLRVELYAVRR
jgi:hypothetical protein